MGVYFGLNSIFFSFFTDTLGEFYVAGFRVSLLLQMGQSIQE